MRNHRLLASRILLGTLLTGGMIGCDQQTINEAARESKQAVDSAADASHRASEASERIIRDANREAGEILEQANEATDGGVDDVRAYGKAAAERVEDAISTGLERSRKAVDGTVDNVPPPPVDNPNPQTPDSTVP